MKLFVNDLLLSYEAHGGINHIDGVNLPSKIAIGDLTRDLLELLFPGFHSENPLHRHELLSHTTELITHIHGRLLQEISKSMDYRPVPNQTAQQLTDRFFKQIAPVRHILSTDVEAAYEGDPAAMSLDEIILAYPGLEAIAVQRLAHLLYADGVALIPRMMTEWVHGETGIDIHPGAQIGTHFFIDHGTGVVIGETTVIGNHVRIYQGVTLGGRSVASCVPRDAQGHAPSDKRHPTIEDDVTIYPNATILGGDTVIGARSIIGGNVWIRQSVPPDSLVTSETQQIQIRPRK